MEGLSTFDQRFLRVSCDSSSRVHDFAQREEVDERFARVSELCSVVDRIPLVQDRLHFGAFSTAEGFAKR